MNAKAYGITYISAELLADFAPLEAAIGDVVEELVGQDKEPKMVMYLDGLPPDLKGKGIIVNKTNKLIAIELFGAETDGWRGKKVRLEVVPVTFGGKTVKGIRLGKA